MGELLRREGGLLLRYTTALSVTLRALSKFHEMTLANPVPHDHVI